MKRPDYFTIQLLKISGIRSSLFNSYSKVLYGDNPDKEISLLNITRPLARFIAGLEDYTKQTNRLSDSSQNALKAFNLSNSPGDLLFNRLPKACSFHEIDPDETNKNKIKGFTNALISVIRELRDAYKNMLAEFAEVLADSLLPDYNEKLELSELRFNIRSRYEGLEEFTVDSTGLRPFIEHITEKEADDKVWFNRLLLFIGENAPNKWTDIERDNAVLRLTEFSNRLIDLRIIQGHYIKNKAKFKESFEIIRVKSMRFGKSDNEEVITIDPAEKEYIDKQKEQFYSFLSQMSSDKSRIAILADILDEYMTAKKKKSGKQDNSDSQDSEVSNG